MNYIKLSVIHPRLILVSALVLACVLFSYPISAQCPNQLSGFEYLGELDDHKYFISQTTTSWSIANDIAFSYGGYLATISSTEENNFILENALLLNTTSTAHIGLNDYASEGNFVWSNGEPVSYNNADLSFNDLGKNNVSINLWQNGGGWTLESVWLQTKFIIELPCDELIPDSNVEILSHTCPNEFPTPGNNLSFDLTVRNTDTNPSAPQTFGLYQSIASDIPIADNLIGQVTINALAPNETTVVTMDNIIMPDPFYFPGFSMNNTQWGPFYVKRFENTTGTSLEPDFNNPPFNIFCQTYTTDIAVSITNSSYKFGDEGIINYEGMITNNGPATAYNIKAIVGKTAFGSIPSIQTTPYQNILTYDDADETKVICINELGAGESIIVDVFYDFDNDLLPESYDVSIIAYSEHLVDTNGSDNSITQTFIYDPNVSDDCPDNISGFQYLGQYNSNRYFLSDAIVHWWEADSLAIENGGELTAIETPIENFFLYEYLNESAWIGMSDFQDENNFVWSNGEAVDFNNIQGANGPILDYVSINHWNGAWILNKPSNKKKFVIEVPCNEEPGSFPDLKGEDIELQATTGAQEYAVGFSFNLINGGNSDAANQYENKIFLSSDPFLSEDDAAVGELDFGFTPQESTSPVQAPEGIAIPWNLLLGSYYVIVVLDYNNDIEESDEMNNVIVSEQTLQVTGNACTIIPNVENGDMTVYGIPQGNSVFILYGAADEIVSMYTCSYDCPQEIEVNNLADGNYSIAFYYFTENWELDCQAYPIDITILFGNISGMEEESDAQYESNTPIDPMTFVEIKHQTLYPNPASDFIFATLESHFERAVQLEVYDINGRRSISKSIQLHKGIQAVELNITELPTGIHHLVLKSESQILSTQRFIKN